MVWISSEAAQIYAVRGNVTISAAPSTDNSLCFSSNQRVLAKHFFINDELLTSSTNTFANIEFSSRSISNCNMPP
jgi:hypothetical protein